jgi:tRNA modification GTPase
MNSSDTIVALSTAPGTGAIAVIRLSGPDALSAVNLHTDISVPAKPSRFAHLRRFVVAGETIDQVLITRFPKGSSYTGEELVEISCHGSPFIVSRILEALLEKVRAAEPGEFTQRAFLNGQLDLTQAEAVNDLINARTARAHHEAIAQLEGGLSRRIAHLLDILTDYRARLELEIDFTDQEVEAVDPGDLHEQLLELLDLLRDLVESGEEGMILRDGFKVALAGAPNVGKSSIFNALLQTERAIVTSIPGTTRDYLEEAVSLDGYLVRIFDTAGLRDTDDTVESIGMEKTRELLESCHLILLIEDGVSSAQPDVVGIFPGQTVRVLNKADLLSRESVGQYRMDGFVICSAIGEPGLGELKKAILEQIGTRDGDSGILTNARQIAAAKRAMEAIEKAVETTTVDYGPELLAFDLSQASEALEEIVGRVTPDDILHRIFDRFCIGK